MIINDVIKKLKDWKKLHPNESILYVEIEGKLHGVLDIAMVRGKVTIICDDRPALLSETIENPSKK